MANSLAALVSQLQNHLSGGLHGQPNYTYSLEQLADEFIQKRGEVLCWMERQGTPVPLTASSQRLDGLIAKPKDWIPSTEQGNLLLANLPIPAHRMAWHHCTIPRLLDLHANPVLYLGPAGRPQKWNVIRELGQLEFQQYRRLDRRMPLCYAEGNDLWITLRDGEHANLLSMVAVFADPREAFRLGLSAVEHRLLDYEETDQNADMPVSLPAFPLDDESAEKVRLRLLNLFLGTHGTRPINPNNGNAVI